MFNLIVLVAIFGILYHIYNSKLAVPVPVEAFEEKEESKMPPMGLDMWLKMHPCGEGSLKGKAFLTEGYFSNGIDSVGLDNKVKNSGLRSDPAIPQAKVSAFPHDKFGVFTPILFQSSL